MNLSGEWMYFGCGREAGHYIFTASGRKLLEHKFDRLGHCFDGSLPPQPEEKLYLASFSRLGGWGLSALAWWDRSVDKRGASNSVIFAPSLTISPDEMLTEAQTKFPWVFNRLPQPLELQR